MSVVELVDRTGDALDGHLDELARLRIRVFRDYPYLYDGDAGYERRYLDTYRCAPGALVVLPPAYRGRGVGVGFFERREAHARRLGGFELACLCAVQRPHDHPARPAGHVPLDDHRAGFADARRTPPVAEATMSGSSVEPRPPACPNSRSR